MQHWIDVQQELYASAVLNNVNGCKHFKNFAAMPLQGPSCAETCCLPEHIELVT
jgi:hypothetical protein